VLERPGLPPLAAGSAGMDPDRGAERAARQALARVDRLMSLAMPGAGVTSGHAVARRNIVGPRGYWTRLHDIGLAITDPAHGKPERDREARAWAESVAVDVPAPERSI
jgi:hypothetical protein